MALQTKTYEDFLSSVITTWAMLLKLSPNLKSGDPVLAMFQAHVLGGLMFVQAQAVAVNKLTRAATSEGADLDSFMADFDFPRLPATHAGGVVKFGVKQVKSNDIPIRPGTIIQTEDGTIQYEVVAESTQPGFSVDQNAYILVAGQLYVNVAVRALNPGSGANVQAGALRQIATGGVGASTVTNLAPIDNGFEAESDQAYRERFKLFINAVNARTTRAGILSAALNTPGVVAVSLIENEDQFGNPMPGYGVIVVDDGSGEPPPELLESVAKNVSAVNAPARGFTVQLLVIGPLLSEVDIALSLKLREGADEAVVSLAAKNAVLDYVNSLTIAQTLHLLNLVHVAKSAHPDVVAVQTGSVTINSAPADHVASNRTVIRTDASRTTLGVV